MIGLSLTMTLSAVFKKYSHQPNPFIFEGLQCLAALRVFIKLFPLVFPDVEPSSQAEKDLFMLELVESRQLTCRLCAWWDGHFTLSLSGKRVELEDFIVSYLGQALYSILKQSQNQNQKPQNAQLSKCIATFLKEKPAVQAVYDPLMNKGETG